MLLITLSAQNIAFHGAKPPSSTKINSSEVSQTHAHREACKTAQPITRHWRLNTKTPKAHRSPPELTHCVMATRDSVGLMGREKALALVPMCAHTHTVTGTKRERKH